MGWIDWILLPIVGGIGGFLAGMLGVGGGIIFIPVLTYLFSQQGLAGEDIVKFTLANSILLVFVSGISGIIKQFKTNTLLLGRMIRIGLPGALISVVWSYFIQQGSWYQKDLFQMVFLGFLIISITNMLFHRKDHEENVNSKAKHNILADIGVAMLAGSVVALSGLGGGVIMVPLFRMILKMPMRQATGLSLSIIPLLSIAPLITYIFAGSAPVVSNFQTGYLVWNYSLPIAISVAIFATIGLKTSKSVPVLYLRIIFAALSTIVFLKTVFDIWNK